MKRFPLHLAPPPRRERSRGWIVAGLIVIYAIIGGLLISAQTGCTMPKTVNFAPLVDLNVKDSANGNTVTPAGF